MLGKTKLTAKQKQRINDAFKFVLPESSKSPMLQIAESLIKLTEEGA